MSTHSVQKFLGRSIFAAPIAQLAWGALTQPGKRTDIAAPTLDAIRQVVPLPVDNETMVRINGGVMAAASATLALNILPRLSSATLLGALAVTTQAGHSFWEIPKAKSAERNGQKIHFLKNVSLMGSLLYFFATAQK